MSQNIHPTVDAILDHPGVHLGTGEVAHIFGTTPVSISEALRTGRIEGHAPNYRGNGMLTRYRVTKHALLKYLWDTTTGDKALLRAALSERAPALLKALENPPKKHTTLSAKPRLADPMADHPELFES